DDPDGKRIVAVISAAGGVIMLFSRFLKGKNAFAAAIFASVAFVAGAIYMYRVPVGTVASYLLTLLILLVVVILAALCLVVLIKLLKKILSR
ncbi:MAG: hypothetical protein ACWA5K_09515, partial [bacterium]